MQCKSCGTELPKKAKVCPKCGELVGKQKSDNLKVIAVAGLVIALIGGLLPFVQNTDVELISDAYSFMNIDEPSPNTPSFAQSVAQVPTVVTDT